jgi:hypothetical protein
MALEISTPDKALKAAADNQLKLVFYGDRGDAGSELKFEKI